MKTIVVTGSAGFIGSHVTEALLSQGYEVIGIDDFNTYYDPKQKEENAAILNKNPAFTLYRTTIENKEALKKIFAKHKPDAIVHLAARAGVRSSIQEPELYARINVQGTIHLLELAKEYNIKKFVFASSSSVYGNTSKAPFKETDPVENPISPYAATKRAGELLCYTYHHLYQLNCVCLRFFTVYGPRGRPDMAPYLFTKAILEGKEITIFGDGTAKRDFTYIADIVQGICAALHAEITYEIINLGNHKPVTLNEFVALIERISGKKAKRKSMPMQPGDVMFTCADLSNAKQILHYEPKTSLETGMREFIAWYGRNINKT